ncbi:MAG TPA: hypothetical protein VJ724_07415, partial [Tahibacter sp.]|nr:hypothetical protein [Tahibacter sp.]
AQAAQTIAFTTSAPTSAQVGTTYAVAATATSGLPVVFTIDAASTAVCSIAGTTVTFDAVGTCTIDANQGGDANWAAAPQAQQTVTVTGCVTLAVGEVAKASMPGGASFCIADAGVDAEYTYLPINVGPSGDVTLSVVANGIQAVTGPPSPRPAPSPFAAFDTSTLPADPHGGIGLDESASRSPLPGGRAPLPSDLIAPKRKVFGPLTVGQLIDVNVAVGGCSVAPDVRKARVEAVTTPQFAGQPLLYAVQEVAETTTGNGDWQPVLPGGFATSDYQNIIDSMVMAPIGNLPPSSFGSTPSILIKTGAMDVATANFGALTDLDANGGLIVLFTKKLNELAPAASSQLVQGMFQARDLFSAAPGSCPGSNEGEILYLMLPDPTGVVNSNVRTQSLVYMAAGPTIVHHYEHLLNAARRVYVNSAPSLEEMWLDEMLAYALQELVFFNAAGLTVRNNAPVSAITTNPNATIKVNAFNNYMNPIYGLARSYFFQLASTNGNKRFGPLRRNPHNTGTTPTVHENAANNFTGSAFFLRYLIDRNNTVGDAAQFNALLNTTAVGRANLQALVGAGVDLDEWARDYLVGIYADDAIGGLAPEYATQTWNIRSLFVALNGTYLLTVNPLTDGTPLANFVLGPGGGARYLRFGVAAGQTANVQLTQGGATPTAPITTAIVRTK